MRIAILGCGYVGVALARRLESNHDVIGVRRSSLDAVRAAGATPIRADVTDPETLSAIPDVDVVVFAASSGGRDAAAARRTFVEGLEAVVADFAGRADPPAQLLYTSSTGVYGDHGGAWVDETTPPEPDSDRGRALLEAESIVRALAPSRGLPGTVARFAGLYGPGRYRLDRYLEGPVEPGYLNLVHRADAAGAVAHLLEDPPDATLVTVVDDEPVERWELARWLADQCGRTPPERLPPDAASGGRATGKRCSNDRLRRLGYTFEFPTFRAGYADGIRDEC